jgi:hypothetical protein
MQVALTSSQRLAIGRLMVGDELSCTAWLISPHHLVTAGHCFNAQYGPAENDFVVGGAPDGARLPLTRVTKHPTLDVAVATLGAPADATVTPLELNTEAPDGTWVGQLAEVAGAGFGTSPASGVTYWPFDIVAVDATAVTIEGNALHGVCRGDSGGPFFKTFGTSPVTRVVALESAGDANCDGSSWGPRADRFAAWAAAQVSAPLPASSQPCEAGAPARCEGEVEWSCSNGWWHQIACGDTSRACGLKSAAEGFGCLPKACGTTDARGRCAAGVAQWCGPGGVETDDCAARGLGCGAGELGARCRSCTACGGVCVDLTQDASHCGACETQCGQAPCQAGVCVRAPVQVPAHSGCSSASGLPWSLALLLLLRSRRSGAQPRGR